MVILNEGKVLRNLRILGKGNKGNPFVKYKGMVIFINGPAPERGESVDVKVTKVGTNCAWGEITKVEFY